MDSILSFENRHTGETLRLRRERDPSGQVILRIEGSFPPHSNGPPPHVHFQQVEEGRVLVGTLGARIAGKTLVVQTGENAAFSAGVVRSWWNAGETLLEFSGRVVPAVDLDQFLHYLPCSTLTRAASRPSFIWLTCYGDIAEHRRW